MKSKVEAEKAFKERQLEAKRVGKIDNGSLYAGSPMYFYCSFCGLESDVLPEDYTCVPNHICSLCQEMVDKGWLEKSRD